MKAEIDSKIQKNELICQTTNVDFDKPDIAKDGYLYEPASVLKWILKHTRSPITLQPSKIEDFIPDNGQQHLTKELRNSTISSQCSFEIVTIPSIDTSVTPIDTQIYPLTKKKGKLAQCLNKFSWKNSCTITSLLFPCTLIILGLICFSVWRNSDIGFI